MKNKLLFFILAITIIPVPACKQKVKTLCLNPDNPHYFMFRGNPVILVGSTEHYGAVLNLDFDYIRYLDELSDKGLNVTRTFSGIYLEPDGAFGIVKNTLAPGPGKLICPWARSGTPGYPGGGNKFDITKWDDNYFARLRDFITEAGKRNIIVELDLFSNFYDTLQWKLSPLYHDNNINNLAPVTDHKEVLSLKHPGILKIQEEMVRKILKECNEFDNIYYEVCNEPYFGDLQALDAWEEHMTNIISSTENELPVQHLISQNIQNGSFKIENPHPAVSIFNFHYAKPPITVDLNYNLNKPIGDNETGFSGIEDFNYRTEAWDFMVAGGALFNNLDYSFTIETEDGSFIVPPGQPGGGGITLRNQLKCLINVFDGLDYLKMGPSNHLIKTSLPEKVTVSMLAEEGNQYLLYLNRYWKDKNDPSEKSERVSTTYEFSIELRAGDYSAEWIDPVTCRITPFTIREHSGGMYSITTPLVNEDIVLKITK